MGNTFIMDWVSVLERQEGLTRGSLTFDEDDQSLECFHMLDAFHPMEGERSYLVADVSESLDGQIEKILLQFRELRDRNLGYRPVMIFNNLNMEQSAKYLLLANAKKSSEVIQITEMFQESISLYIDTKEVVLLADERGINYLNYSVNLNSQDHILNEHLRPIGANIMQYENTVNDNPGYSDALHGNVYNLSFLELKKLYNVTGANLFKSNIRYGIVNKKASKSLRSEFKKYFYSSILSELKKKGMDGNFIESVEETLETKESDSIDFRPDCFWFLHNGITIFCSGDVDNPGNEIKFKSNEVSVINGAQTITNVFNIYYELFHKIAPDIRKDIDSSKLPKEYSFFCEKNIRIVLDRILGEIKIKTIIIAGDKSHESAITLGLNEQIPITQETIIAASPEVDLINTAFSGQLKVLKDGETSYVDLAFTVLDFVKHIYTIFQYPGKSKNLQKAILLDTIVALSSHLHESSDKVTPNYIDTFVDSLKVLISTYAWWDKQKRIEKKSNEAQYDINNFEIVAKSYGKNYFGAYVVRELRILDKYNSNSYSMLDDLEEGILLQLYIKWLELITDDQELTLNMFKKDELYHRQILGETDVLAIKLEKALTFESDFFNSVQNDEPTVAQDYNSGLPRVTHKQDLILSESEKHELIQILNSEHQSPYTFYSTIIKFLNSIHPHSMIENLRVVKVDVNNMPVEAYPFNNRTFSEISVKHSITEIDKIDLNYKEEYDESLFKKEVNTGICLIVLTMSFGHKFVEEISIVNDFSFSIFDNEASKVYQLTCQAFDAGDSNAFPKSSMNYRFHVRPKALNSLDTFEFSNGDMITKRTFWANRSTIKELLDRQK